jgi:uncharacterized coiled-coil protein SlyX
MKLRRLRPSSDDGNVVVGVALRWALQKLLSRQREPRNSGRSGPARFLLLSRLAEEGVSTLEERVSFLEGRLVEQSNTLSDIRQAIASLDGHVDSRLTGLDRKIDQRFDVLDHKLDQRFDLLDRKLDHKIEALDGRMNQRFEAQDGKMNQRFEAQDAKMDRRFDLLDAKMTRQFTWLVGLLVGALAAGFVAVLTR